MSTEPVNFRFSLERMTEEEKDFLKHHAVAVNIGGKEQFISPFIFCDFGGAGSPYMKYGRWKDLSPEDQQVVLETIQNADFY